MFSRFVLLLSVAACLLVFAGTNARPAQAQVHPAEAEAAIRYHFPAGVEDAMVVVSDCETGLGSDIYNEGSGAHGIFQEIPETAAAYNHDYSALANPWYAAEAAYDLWVDGGYSPWRASSWCHGYW